MGKRVPLGRLQKMMYRGCTVYFVQPGPDMRNVIQGVDSTLFIGVFDTFE
jgi:hypothetical protein